jgi:hypothetical protein
MVIWTDRDRARGGSGWLPLVLAFVAGALSLAVVQRYFPEAAPSPRPHPQRPTPRAAERAPVELSWGPLTVLPPTPAER